MLSELRWTPLASTIGQGPLSAVEPATLRAGAAASAATSAPPRTAAGGAARAAAGGGARTAAGVAACAAAGVAAWMAAGVAAWAAAGRVRAPAHAAAAARPMVVILRGFICFLRHRGGDEGECRSRDLWWAAQRPAVHGGR